MEDILFYASVSLIFLSLAFKLFLRKNSTRRINLPPSPPSLPVIGHLHLLKQPVHRTFHRLSQTYGPIFLLKFGSKRVIVISSPAAAQECFTKNDIILANRPRLLMGKHLSYNYSTIGASPYGDHWRNLRRFGAIEIFSTSRINSFSGMRRDEVKRLLRKLSEKSTGEFSKVNLQRLLPELTFNIVMRMAAGKRYYGDEVSNQEEAARFRELMKEVSAHGGASNPGDFLPILNWVGRDGYEKKIKKLGKRVDAFLQGLVDEHRMKKEEGRNTMIDHLLSLQHSEPEYYSEQFIKGFVLALILAGTDTTAVTLEWAMSHLLNNPEVLIKAKAELDSQVGEARWVDEADMLKLPFLRGVISETLRLNPAVPMLVPHFSSSDCTVGGYDLPRDTILLVNAWAIHRDPNVWDEPAKFKPERYEDEKETALAQKLLPFGLGRRACPGSSMAQRVVGFALASLIQCFEWERESPEEIDMAEGRGVTMPKARPLEPMCKPRPVMDLVLAKPFDAI